MPQLIVYNSCYGEGFNVHKDVLEYLDKESVSRDDQELAAVVAGETDYDGRISGGTACLDVEEVPDGISWDIMEHDGMEKVVCHGRKV